MSEWLRNRIDVLKCPWQSTDDYFKGLCLAPLRKITMFSRRVGLPHGLYLSPSRHVLEGREVFITNTILIKVFPTSIFKSPLLYSEFLYSSITKYQFFLFNMCNSNKSTTKALCGHHQGCKPQHSFLADQVAVEMTSPTMSPRSNHQTTVPYHQKGSSAAYHYAGHAAKGSSSSHHRQVRRSFPKLGASCWTCVCVSKHHILFSDITKTNLNVSASFSANVARAPIQSDIMPSA